VRELVKEIRKKFGEDSVFLLTDKDLLPKHEQGFISTGLLAIDWLIGRPGLPLGRIVEIAGFESVGKSTLAAQLLLRFQKAGGLSILLDTEHSYSRDWLENLGFDLEKLFVFQPRSMEDAFGLIEFLLKKVNHSVPLGIVWDSVSATPTEEELNGDCPLGMHARVLSRGLRVLTNMIWERQVCLICVSKLKEKTIGFGHIKLGGHAIGYHAALMFEIEKRSLILVDRETVGLKCRFVVVKNKVAPPYRSLVLDVMFDGGIQIVPSTLELLRSLKLVKELGGGWFELDGARFQRKNASEFINDDFVCSLRNSIFGGEKDVFYDKS